MRPPQNRLLPSAIEDDPEIYNARVCAAMKRRAPPCRLVLSHLDPSLEASATPSQPAKRNASGVDDREHPYTLKTAVGLARFWETKAAALEGPFNFERGVNGPVPLKIDYQGIIRPSKPQKIHKYEGTEKHAPLNNDAIADILRHCKPDCPKTQAWVNAHEASKGGKERMRAKVKEREGLRKKVLHKASVRSLQALKEADALREEVDVPQEGEEEYDWNKVGNHAEVNDWDDGRTVKMKAGVRVQVTSVRLRNLVWNDEAPDHHAAYLQAHER
ncbi:hypothetical protein BDW59DRAFT_165974 [Aspergillus cavernicola]|uniref:Uncharacterized protein n=1 Tax=Aspergillus cavernicola TaxID=176166 RepID=A0ABR4HPP9_9EURO